MSGVILTLNAGSSSIKFAVYDRQADLTLIARGKAERLFGEPRLSLAPAGGNKIEQAIPAQGHGAALSAILERLEPYLGGRQVSGVGHRVVHGGPDYEAPQPLDDAAIDKLAGYEPLAPLHQPHNLAAVRAARAEFPQAVQVGCFDTAFHRGHPWEHDTYALPQRFYDMGVRRYGFHGLSYDYIAGHLAETEPDLAFGRVIVAHLGNGASMCAMAGGQSVSSTMGFSAIEGLPMGTRAGQIDPGVLLYMQDALGMSSDEITALLYKESGLKGLSGLTNDMRQLLESEAEASRAAISYFTTRIRHHIGALSADLGGLDGLVFTGGIGENAAPVRAMVCGGLGWMGIGLDETANAGGVGEIGTGPVRVLVIPTNEEIVIARAVEQALKG